MLGLRPDADLVQRGLSRYHYGKYIQCKEKNNEGKKSKGFKRDFNDNT